MRIYKAGSKYFSTHHEAKTYREKYFSSTRQVDIINIESKTINEADEIVVKAYWYLNPYQSVGLHLGSYWCIGSLSEYLEREQCTNILKISKRTKDSAQVDAYLIFRNMAAARYQLNSKKFLSLLEEEVNKVPVGSEVQIKI